MNIVRDINRKKWLSLCNLFPDEEKKCCFIKRSNGKKRIMRFTKFGGKVGFNAVEKGLLPVIDADIEQGRMINLDSVIWFEVKGKRFFPEKKQPTFADIKSITDANF